jgi:hypothetical protein
MKTRSLSLLPLIAVALAFAPARASAQSALPDLTRLGCPALPSTVTQPFAFAIVNNSCVNVSQYITTLQPGIFSLATPQLAFGAGTVQLTATFKSDPFITFGATTTNITAGPTTYAFLFGTPIVPGFYTTATSNGSLSVTNGAGGTATVDNGDVYPTYISGYGTNGAFATNLGVDLGTAPCVASGPPATVTTSCPQGSAANSFAPTFYDNLEALVTYTQTDIGSVVSITGGVTLEAAAQTVVPEPASMLLLATGLSAIGGGGLARRRRRGAAAEG